MANLACTYMGLKLSNPLIVASCSLTRDVEGVKHCTDAGAGAVVLKSLFEEQIKADAKELQRGVWLVGYSEAVDYVRNIGMALGPREYLNFIEAAKKAVKIPVIASLNCVTTEGYADYAEKIASAGADGLELNMSIMPVEATHKSGDIEKIYYRILEQVAGSIEIPVAVKLGPYFTSLSRVTHEMCQRGAGALVLFNRFYQLDINIEQIELSAGYRFSSSDEISQSLRWIALLAGRVNCDFAASTGVHDGAGAVKQLLAGANAVQVCSALYLKGVNHIQTMLMQIQTWMQEHDFKKISDFQGKLSQKKSDRPELFERLQYIRALVGIE